MKVAFVLPNLFPFAGAEIVALRLAHALSARGIEVDFVLGWEPADLTGYLPEGSRLINLGGKRTRELLWPLRRYFREAQPDGVIVSLWPLTCTAIIARFLAGSKTAVLVSDHNMLSIQYADKGFFGRLALLCTMGLTYPFAKARVAVSDGVAHDLARVSLLPFSKFSVVHNPVAAISAELRDATAVEKLWRGWKGPRILTVGRFKRQKNHALLIRSFKALLSDLDARLMIVGTGEDEEAIKRLVLVEGVADRVFFAGQTDDTAPYYLSADLFVLSSDYEGFGNVIVEALAGGLRVVSTDCRSGPAEILENGRYGRLVPVGDAAALTRAMREILDAPHDSELARRRAKDFLPELIAEQYLRLMFPQVPKELDL